MNTILKVQVAGAILEKEEGPVATFEFVALTLPSLADPSIAIAASRAGAIGVVDVSFLRGDAAEDLATAAIATFARFGHNRCGIRLDPADEGVASAVISSLPPTMGMAILVPAAPDLLSRHADLLRALDAQLLLEVTSLDEARLAEALGFDGVIAKGYEAGGRVGETTTFVLLQQLASQIGLPVWAQGGIGEHTAAACAVAGAAGVVLDSQLALTRESGLPAGVKAEIARMDGSETSCVGLELGEGYRLYEWAGRKAGPRLRELERTLAAQDPGLPRAAAWREGVAGLVGWSSPDDAWLLGQDAAFAAGLAKRFRTVGGVLKGLREAVGEHLALASRLRPLAEGGPMAQSHGTRYPIVQGPMTRVSDVAGFARDVVGAGALPFLALAVMRGPQVEALLRDTRQTLGERPWGAGILGFVPLELREEQMEVLRRYPPTFALIAGGRPDQALSLEREGIPTYLHVPSPGLLRLFAGAGARRFVLEGRECGGHVGPRTSFVLWNTMIDTLLDSVPPGDLPDCHVLFAGGIHDATSAAMVAAMAAPLAEAGVKVGVLLGTAYLFTEEAVAAGAITPGFQAEAVRCTGTVLLSSGPGHATRCADTPFAGVFRSEQRRLSAEDLPADEVRVRLEMLNLGRLRIASKGIDRNPARRQDADAPPFVTLSASEQAGRGMYMLGQVAALRGGVVTLAELHHDVSVRGAALLDRSTDEERPPRPAARVGGRTSIAIVGMSCLLPRAPSIEAYWQNILDKVDAIVEIPPDRWDWRHYFDADPLTPDKIYSKWGGFVDKIPFDPVSYGMPPNTLPSIEPLQMLILEAVRAGLDDAGYLDRPFPRQHTGVILGVGGAGDLASRYGLRAALPSVPADIGDELLDSLPAWTPDSFPGILLNVAAGRVANRFDLGGVNYTVDAACASSLAAVYLAVRELEAGTADMMIVGGADASQTPFGYLCFSRTYALSPRGRCRAFDASADGIAISEGFGVVVLKRLADAERDGDHIYAVLKGIGGSSDGRDKSLTAPRPEGQALAVERAYAEAGFSPATVGLIEAHGTGTVAGDRAELTTLTRVFGAAGAPAQGCAIGSVKSMIGHTKGTAGVAGLIKVALGMDRKVLPPTMHVERPNPAASNGEGPFYLNTEARPWLRPPGAPPRRAGVSAFGFGGTNFHVAVEEYTGDDYLPGAAPAPVRDWPSELLCWSAASLQELRERLQTLGRALGGAREEPPLREVAHAVWAEHRPGQPVRLAIVARTAEDLRSTLARVSEALTSPRAELRDPSAYLTATPLAGSGPAAGAAELGPAAGAAELGLDAVDASGKIAFLYPGQGSQHPDMLRDLAVSFPEVRGPFELADAVLAGRFERPLSSYVFAPPGFSPEGQQARVEALKPTDRAQPALGAAGMGLSRLLAALGVRPALVAGHSYGEYVALCSAGVIAEDVLYRLSEARGRCIVESAAGEGGAEGVAGGRGYQADLGTMAAVPESAGRVQEVLGAAEDVWVANLNAPRQTVISGTRRGIERAVELLTAAGIGATALTVACGFHSPLVAPARERLARVLGTVTLQPPRLPVYSNTEARRYPAEPERIARLLADHLVEPVRFAEQIDQMYADGARLFVEAGPGGVLTGLVGQVLGTRPHLALRTQGSGHGITALQHALAQLHAHGVDLDLDRLYHGRVTGRLRLDALDHDPAPLPETTWLVDPGSAQPLNGRTTAVKRPTTPRQGSSPNGDREAAPALPALPVLPVLPVPALPAQAAAADGHARMVLAFQQLMSKFLDTQQEVMTTYLQGARNGSANGSGNGVANGHANGFSPAAVEPAVEPIVEPSVEPTPALSEDGPVDAERVTKELIRVVAERTGYPPEMLDLDVDIEAELGIDSIKKVEILGAAQQELGTSAPTEVGPDALGGEAMETLARARTLRALVEAIVALATQHDGPGENVHESPTPEVANREAAEPEAAKPETPTGELPRFAAAVVPAPREATEQSLRFDGIVAITDDERGVARDLTALLSEQGIEVALIRDQPLPAQDSDGYAARLGDAQAARDLVEAVHRRQGPIACLVHLLPLRDGPPFDELDIRGWQARLDRETRALFHLAQAASADLRRGTTRTCLLAAVQLDGAFGFHGDGVPFQPSHGGVVGFVKTLAREWPEVECKVVDLGQDVSGAAERLAAELRPASD
ncbi:MAG: beta-ketoacyl synthase N-terminal-like domain-containing protein, partial [Egibacteraceae bacterium]